MRRRNARSVGATDEWTSCELECATTPPVRDDSARSHLMSSQLGWNQPSGEFLNFSQKVSPGRAEHTRGTPSARGESSCFVGHHVERAYQHLRTERMKEQFRHLLIELF